MFLKPTAPRNPADDKKTAFPKIRWIQQGFYRAGSICPELLNPANGSGAGGDRARQQVCGATRAGRRVLCRGGLAWTRD